MRYGRSLPKKTCSKKPYQKIDEMLYVSQRKIFLNVLPSYSPVQYNFSLLLGLQRGLSGGFGHEVRVDVRSGVELAPDGLYLNFQLTCTT